MRLAMTGEPRRTEPWGSSAGLDGCWTRRLARIRRAARATPASKTEAKDIALTGVQAWMLKLRLVCQTQNLIIKVLPMQVYLANKQGFVRKPLSYNASTMPTACTHRLARPAVHTAVIYGEARPPRRCRGLWPRPVRKSPWFLPGEHASP